MPNIYKIALLFYWIASSITSSVLYSLGNYKDAYLCLALSIVLFTFIKLDIK